MGVFCLPANAKALAFAGGREQRTGENGSINSPQVIPLAPLDPRPSSRYTRPLRHSYSEASKPELLFTAPFVLAGKSTAQRRMADLLHNPVMSKSS